MILTLINKTNIQYYNEKGLVPLYNLFPFSCLNAAYKMILQNKAVLFLFSFPKNYFTFNQNSQKWVLVGSTENEGIISKRILF